LNKRSLCTQNPATILTPSGEDKVNPNSGLSYQARKALNVHIGEAAGTEIANLLQRLAAQIEELKRSKVNVTPVVPPSKNFDGALTAFERDSF